MPTEGLAPGVDIFFGDSAYARANVGDGLTVRIPVPVPQDGSAPKVHFNQGFVLFSQC